MLRPLSQDETERIQKDFLIEYTYNSNAIEGNSLTLQETALVLEGITVADKPLKDHLEAVGHRDAFLYVQQLIGDHKEISEWDIKSVHSLVLIDRPDDRGVYRSVPVTIAGAFQQPPQPYLVAIQMESLVKDYTANQAHTLEQMAIFHLKFEGIHPFIDGNGRTGRLLMNYQLMMEGFPPIIINFADRKTYYECFDSFYRDNNTIPMIKLIVEILEKQLDRSF